MPQLKTLGDRIRYYRRQKGWSQTQLWRALGMKQSRLSKIENDSRTPYFWEMERIAFFLEVPLSFFDGLRNTTGTHLDASTATPPAPPRR